jgi:hypothetical protein
VASLVGVRAQEQRAQHPLLRALAVPVRQASPSVQRLAFMVKVGLEIFEGRNSALSRHAHLLNYASDVSLTLGNASHQFRIVETI